MTERDLWGDVPTACEALDKANVCERRGNFYCQCKLAGPHDLHECQCGWTWRDLGPSRALPHPASHHRDPETSKNAAKDVRQRSQESQAAKCEGALLAAGLRGCTHDEICESYGWSDAKASRRLGELRDADVCFRTDDSRPTRTGSEARVYIHRNYAAQYEARRLGITTGATTRQTALWGAEGRKRALSGQDSWATPLELYNALEAEFGPFTLDPCPLNGADGLSLSWIGQRVFCNPPYSSIAPWLDKANEAECAVYLLPSRTGSQWFADATQRANLVRFLRGRLKFVGAKTAAPFDSIVLAFFANEQSRRWECDEWQRPKTQVALTLTERE